MNCRSWHAVGGLDFLRLNIRGRCKMKCAFCEKPVCLHGRYLLSVVKEGFVSRCRDCGTTGGVDGLDMFCLPTHKGEVDFSSGVYSTACPDCHDLYTALNINVDA